MRRTFDRPGPDNTEKTLAILAEAVEEYRVKQVVIASTWGNTGLAAARLFEDEPINLVIVTHNVGFKEPGTHEMSREMRNAIENLGATVYTGTMPFRNIGTAIREKQGYSQQDLVANTLRLFGQGVKVCVEIVLMAADAGLISTSDVLAVAGTGRGADTIALIEPQSSNKLFSLKIRDIIAKPAHW